MKRHVLFELLLTFMKIGLFTFGGGYAMIPMIEGICVEEKKWITSDEMLNITVIAESTPGPIAINCATFVGYQQAGFAGALAATLGIVLPSFAVIYAISLCLDNFLEITVIANAFRGIKAAVGLLIIDAAIKMIRKMKKKRLSSVIIAASCGAMLLINLLDWKISSISLMLAAAAAGLAALALTFRPVQKGGETS